MNMLFDIANLVSKKAWGQSQPENFLLSKIHFRPYHLSYKVKTMKKAKKIFKVKIQVGKERGTSTFQEQKTEEFQAEYMMKEQMGSLIQMVSWAERTIEMLALRATEVD